MHFEIINTYGIDQPLDFPIYAKAKGKADLVIS